MEDLFLPRIIGSSIELIAIIVMFVFLAIIRNSNPLYGNFLLNNLFLKKDRLLSTLVGRSLENKSAFFVNFISLIVGTIFLSKTFSLPFISLLFVLLVFKLIQTICIVGFEKTFVVGDAMLSFSKRRLALTELSALIILIFLFVTTSFSFGKDVYLVVLAIVLLIEWIKTSIVLEEYLSVSHIILYLCALEILPILILVKFIYKHLES